MSAATPEPQQSRCTNCDRLLDTSRMIVIGGVDFRLCSPCDDYITRNAAACANFYRKHLEQALVDLTTLRARVEAVEAERDNDKAAFDAMRPFVAQIEQTIASAAEQIQQAEAVASEIAAERDRLVSALAGVREHSQQYKAALEQIAKRDDTEMAVARTLHYDMRGWARAALRGDGEGQNDA